MQAVADRPRKLGLLAGTFEDGSLSVYVVPYPEDMRPNNASTDSGTIYGTPLTLSAGFILTLCLSQAPGTFVTIRVGGHCVLVIRLGQQ